MKPNLILEKSMELALSIVDLYKYLCAEKREFVISKQLLRSGTSVGANISEAIYGNSKADFISKLHISLKEVNESIYWLTLLIKTKIIAYDYEKMLSLAEEIKRMLISSLKTAKDTKNE